MDAARANAWEHFCDRVLCDTSWPRGLWFAAVEDALTAALGADARLLADYRADVAELLGLERAARGTYHDEQRVAQLEAQIKRLIELADATISAPAATVPDAPAAVAAAPRRGRPPARYGPALSLLLGVLLVVAGAAGATAFYELRLRAEVDRQVARMGGLLDERVADLRADLDQRLSAAESLHAQMAQLHDQLSANVDRVSTTMTDSVRSIMGLSDNAVAELERRLGAQGNGVTDALAKLRARAEALNRGLDDISQDLASLEQRVPKLRDDVQDTAAGVQQVRTGFNQAAAEVGAVKAGTPQLIAWLAGQKDTLAQELQGRRAELDAIRGQARDLQGEMAQSRARLEDLNQSLDQSLHQARQDSAALEDAIKGLHATGQQVTQLMADADAKVQAAHQEMQTKIDQMLSNAAEKADLAVLRSQDVIHRAEGEVTQKLQANSQQALDDLAKAREGQLAELAKRVAAAQAELEQTRAGLVASWQGMDHAVAERQGQVLTGLDGYAQTIQARVQDLLKALDVKVAGSSG